MFEVLYLHSALWWAGSWAKAGEKMRLIDDPFGCQYSPDCGVSETAGHRLHWSHVHSFLRVVRFGALELQHCTQLGRISLMTLWHSVGMSNSVLNVRSVSCEKVLMWKKRLFSSVFHLRRHFVRVADLRIAIWPAVFDFHLKMAIKLWFWPFDVHSCDRVDRHLKIAIRLQFLTFEVHFSCERVAIDIKIGNSLQFWTFDLHFSCERVRRTPQTNFDCSFLRSTFILCERVAIGTSKSTIWL